MGELWVDVPDDCLPYSVGWEEVTESLGKVEIMAYSDYLHCYDCEAKVISWGNWDWKGCAHCVGDNERALEGVVAVYCSDCTVAKGLVKPPPTGYVVEKAQAPDGTLWSSGHWGHRVTTAKTGKVQVRWRNNDPDWVELTVGNRRKGVRIPEHAWEWLRFELLMAAAARTRSKK